MEIYSGGVINVEKLLLEYCHPVGSLYISEKSTDPATLFGGTWERIKDRFILAAGDSYSAGSTGGEASHTLTVSEMPSHTHGIETNETYTGGAAHTGWRLRMNSKAKGTAWDNPNDAMPNLNQTWTIYTGGNAAHNNMPPYLAMYVWKRTA